MSSLLWIIILLLGLPIPLVPFILWLEINVYGETCLPETLVVTQVLVYLYWRWIWWKFLYGTRNPIKGKGYT